MNPNTFRVFTSDFSVLSVMIFDNKQSKRKTLTDPRRTLKTSPTQSWRRSLLLSALPSSSVAETASPGINMKPAIGRKARKSPERNRGKYRNPFHFWHRLHFVKGKTTAAGIVPLIRIYLRNLLISSIRFKSKRLRFFVLFAGESRRALRPE